MTPERRQRLRDGWQAGRTVWRDFIRDVFFTFGLLDERGDVSVTMSLAYLFGWTGVHGRLFHDVPITLLDFWTMVLAAFAGLGYKGLRMWKEMRTPQPPEGTP